jgi:PhnB protein
VLDAPQIHLSFNGQCEAALRFYERCFGAKIVALFTWGEPTAQQAPPEWAGKLAHATLAMGETVIFGADLLPGQYEPPQGFSITVGVSDADDAERIFHALAENASVKMPIQETCWAVRFGALVDQFGIPWSINCEQSPQPLG